MGGAGRGGGWAPPHLPSRVWVSPGCHRPPGQSVPSTGQGRGEGGEGAFLGCLGAESPPATAATRTRRDTPRPHTQSVCTEQNHARVTAYGHTQRPERADQRSAACTWAHAVTCVRTRSDTHTAWDTHRCTLRGHVHTDMHTHVRTLTDLGAVQAHAPLNLPPSHSTAKG